MWKSLIILYSDRRPDWGVGDFDIWIHFSSVITNTLRAVQVRRPNPSPQQVYPAYAIEHDEERSRRRDADAGVRNGWHDQGSVAF